MLLYLIFHKRLEESQREINCYAGSSNDHERSSKPGSTVEPPYNQTALALGSRPSVRLGTTVESRTRDIWVSADIRTDSLSTGPPKPPKQTKSKGILELNIRNAMISAAVTKTGLYVLSSIPFSKSCCLGGLGGTGGRKPALRSANTLLSWVRAPPAAT
ncbi:hypothetical protein PoB_001264300 [Plakobranchus ocellatus]|uniref:Uncharacterized protein n=1 Tax=Plakobranchus ocellatus TaxID=259542 RepID=A0AAV3YV79_9GAST|nr:hypothetical protein PoB_001264300 [Plakobranchus ocellatus]